MIQLSKETATHCAIALEEAHMEKDTLEPSGKEYVGSDQVEDVGLGKRLKTHSKWLKEFI